jgi:hypothetical protein
VLGMCVCWLYSREYGECPVADTWLLRANSAIHIYLSQSPLCWVRKLRKYGMTCHMNSDCVFCWGSNVVVKFIFVPISVTNSFHKSVVNLVFLLEISNLGIP